MESLNITSDLIKDENIKSFGNMRFFLSGAYLINKKGLGLYFTLITIIFTTFITFKNM